MIFYIASYPRSGNIWIQSLLFESFRLLSSSVYPQHIEGKELRIFRELDPNFNLPILSEEINTSAHAQFKELVNAHGEKFDSRLLSSDDRAFLDSSSFQELLKPYGKDQLYFLSGNGTILEYPIIRQYLASSDQLFVIKTHERPYHTYYPGEKVIQIIRNPGAVFWSYLHFLKDSNSIASTLEDIILGNVGLGDWSQYQQLWLLERKMRPQDFLVVFYEDLVKNSNTQVERISKFLGRPIIGTGKVSFDKLHDALPLLVREGKASNWEKNYTTNQLNMLWDRHKDLMTILGYPEPDFKLALKVITQDTDSTSETPVEDLVTVLLRQELSDLTEQITILQTRVNKNRETIQLQARMIEEVNNQISELNVLLAETTSSIEESKAKIAHQELELIEKEKVIRQLAIYQRSSFRHLVLNKLFPKLRRGRLGTWVVNKIVVIKRVFSPRLFILNQYSPREFTIPQKYKNQETSRLSPNQPTVSIVTPSFNQAAFLERTIQSVVGQNYPNLEYIVQDGGSRDGSTKILKRFNDRITHWESRPDNGQAHAINLGFKKTSGDIMAYINSDDIYLPGAIQYVVNFFQKHPEVDAVYGHRVMINEVDQEIGVWILPNHHSNALYYADYVPQETLFWRRSIWEKTGGIDESFKFAMDWDMLLRFQDAGAKFVRLPRFLAAFRVHVNQKTSHQLNAIGLQEMRAIQSKYFDHIDDKIIFNKLKFYRRRATFHHLLYRSGLLKI